MTATPPLPPPQLARVADVDTARESVAEVCARLEKTIHRASSFSEDERHRRVNDEWSVVESLRHLVLVIDRWLSVVRDRVAALHQYVESLTPEELARPIEAHTRTVAGALATIFHELAAHDRFINRDLDRMSA